MYLAIQRPSPGSKESGGTEGQRNVKFFLQDVESEEPTRDDLGEHANEKGKDSEHKVGEVLRHPSMNQWGALGVESLELLAAVLYLTEI